MRILKTLFVLAMAMLMVSSVAAETPAGNTGSALRNADETSAITSRLYPVRPKTPGKDDPSNPMAAAITITPDDDPNHLIDALVVPGTGITVTSVTFNGAAAAAGIYVEGPFGISDGIILASGEVTNALPPDASTGTTTDFGLPGCEECNAIIPGYTSYDAAKFIVVFDVDDSAQSISFDFVFGSEEYPEYVGSSYNDVYGAYLNGIQISFDADANPITINGPFFSGPYVHIPPENGLEYDGSTTRLTTTAPIGPGSTDNTLVFVVCDAGDRILDSGVMLADLESDVTSSDTIVTGISPEFVPHGDLVCGDTVAMAVGGSVTLDIEAMDIGPNEDVLTLTATGLPAGATMTPTLPLTGNPVASTFDWTPAAEQAGMTFNVTFFVADSIDGFTENCQYIFVVEDAADSCFPDLPAPELVMEPCPEYYESPEGSGYRYSMDVSNWHVYPIDLFEPRPDLPPCGTNPNASRTWVDMYSSEGVRIHGFCGFGDPEDLNLILFAIPEGEEPPDSVYITLTDRLCDIVYTSNVVATAAIQPAPVIECPAEPMSFVIDAPGEVCFDLPILHSESVTSNGSWADGQLCFDADTSAEYELWVAATNECGFDSCMFTVEVTIDAEHVTPTNAWIDIYCEGPNYNGTPLEIGDTIKAYDPDGVLCGLDVVREGQVFGFMPIYHDDIYTDFDEGAEAGDLISFKINDLAVLSNPEIYWTAHGDAFEVCDFYNCRPIHLDEGWNLISWNLNYEAGVSELAELLPKNGCLEVILSFDRGALTYDPALPHFSTLKEVDYFHGYWIHMLCEADISICGKKIPADQCIPLYEGWNLASYWPDVTLPTDEALGSVMDNLEVALAYDDGYMVYVPTDIVSSTLDEMPPLFGYWLKMNADDNLEYPGWSCITDGGAGRARAPLAYNDLVPSRNWMSIYGEHLTIDGELVEPNATIEAYRANGTLVGRGVYSDGRLMFTPLYGYDGTSSDYPRDGELVTIRIDGRPVYPQLAFTGEGRRVAVARFLSEPGGNGTVPNSFSLAQNYPNPFNPTTSIDFSLAEANHVELTVFNVLGQEVVTLLSGQLAAGHHNLTWDGHDNQDRQVSTGVYLYRLTAGNSVATRKMLLTK